MTHYDVIVAGLGAMGSATLYQLAKMGVNALGLDKYEPPHGYGSTYGDTRITRLAVGEGAQYVPFVKRSHEIWAELEAATGRPLFLQSGGYIIAPQENAAAYHGSQGVDFATATATIARQHKIEHEMRTAEQVMDHVPMFKLKPSEHAVFEPTAGVVLCESAVEVQIQEAKRLGATVRTNTPLLSYQSNGNGVIVETPDGPLQCRPAGALHRGVDA